MSGDPKTDSTKKEEPYRGIIYPDAVTPAKWKMVGANGAICGRTIPPDDPNGQPPQMVYARVVKRSEPAIQPVSIPGIGNVPGKEPDGEIYWEWSDCTDPAHPMNPLNTNNILSVAPAPIMKNEHRIDVWYCASAMMGTQSYHAESLPFTFEMNASGQTDCC